MPPLQLPAVFTPTHDTAGLPGYPARDFFAPARTVVLAPCGGLIRRLSGHPPTTHAQPGGPYGWSVYLRAANGDDYYMTHFGVRFVWTGQRVRRGQQLGTVADYAHATHGVTPSHIHMGCKRHT